MEAIETVQQLISAFLTYFGNTRPHSRACHKHLFICHFQAFVDVCKASLKCDLIDPLSIFFGSNLRPGHGVEGYFKLGIVTVGDYCYMGTIWTNIEGTNDILQETQHQRPSSTTNTSR